MSIRRLFQRFGFHSAKLFFLLISLMNHRLYMKYYVPFLRKYGMEINGTPRFIAIDVKFDDFNKVILSDRDVISTQVYFLTHDYSYTTALISQGAFPDTDISINRSIEVGKNVFIGARSFLLPGTKIGDDCIIGAGSVVRGCIPSRSVYIGNPGKVICSIDNLAVKWGDLNQECLKKD